VRSARPPPAPASGLAAALLLAALGLAPGTGHPAGEPPAAPGGTPAAEVARWGAEIERGGPAGAAEALIRRGEAYRALGHLYEALADFEAARAAAGTAGSPQLESASAFALGRVLLLLGRPEESRRTLEWALGRAESLGLPTLAAGCADSLGLALAGLGRTEEARALYGRALAHAQAAGDPGLGSAIRLNLARSASGAPALEALEAAHREAGSVDDGGERVQLLLGIAAQAESTPGAGGLAERSLDEALALAEGLGERRAIALASGMQGARELRAGRLGEARRLTERAIDQAQLARADDLLLRFELQLGQTLRQQGDQGRALLAYRRAVHQVQAVRRDLPIEDASGQSAFESTLRPIYLGLADLLLRRVGETPDPEAQQGLLREAQSALERLKVSEVRDFLKDSCIAALTEEVGSLAADTAVIYPIVLPDRLEILVGVGGRLHRASVPVGAEELGRVLGTLAEALRFGLAYGKESVQLYDWLIRPIEPQLAGQSTLVFVPDGPLRTVPLAALHDGERYLVERFAIATAPGLTLLDPRPLPRRALDTLLAGLSRPGPVVGKLPPLLLNDLKAEAARSAGPARGGGEAGPAERGVDDRAVANLLALPGVTVEIAQLAQTLPAKVLMDDGFVLDAFARELDERPYRIVHIASHGYFGGSPEESFVLTYDERLDMDRLAALLRPKQVARDPVELLALSACQTAEGDDRTPLGLSGVALKSGARSVLGSLWPVQDEAARRLMQRFYAEVQRPGVSKAQALAKAQTELLKTRDFAHPVFWAPFILVGNWL
jgi:CHAT domain-containing protein